VDAVAARVPRHRRDPVGVTLQADDFGLAGDVPDDDDLLLAGGGEARPVGAEGDGADRLRGSGQLGQQVAGGAVPDADGTAVMAGRDAAAVAVEGDGADPRRLREGAEELAVGDVVDGQVVTAGGEQAGGGVERPQGAEAVEEVPAELPAVDDVPAAEDAAFLE